MPSPDESNSILSGIQIKEQEESILTKLVNIKFQIGISFMDSCLICMCPFQENDLIAILPCDIRHFFHTECIKSMIHIDLERNKKTQCPLCKTDIWKKLANTNFYNYKESLMKSNITLLSKP